MGSRPGGSSSPRRGSSVTRPAFHWREPRVPALLFRAGLFPAHPRPPSPSLPRYLWSCVTPGRARERGRDCRQKAVGILTPLRSAPDPAAQPSGGGATELGEGSWGEGPTAQPAIARTRALGPRGQTGLRQRSRANQQGRPPLKEPQPALRAVA